MKHISKYFFSILLVLISFSIHAQKEKDSTVTTSEKSKRYGIRFGVDLFKLSRSFYEKDYKGLEIVGDYRLTKNYYLAGEIGNENKTVDDDRLNFTTKGSYFKVGFDYNVYRNWLEMENMIYLGARYGISSFNHELNSYKIYNPNPYFGETPVFTSGEKFDGLSAQWLEFVLGVKTELFSNFYAGISVRMNYLVANKKPNEFDNLYIPGFNKTYDGKFGVGFNYTVSYFLPLFKKKK